MESETELELMFVQLTKVFSSLSKRIRSMINLHCWSHCTGAWDECLLNQGYVIFIFIYLFDVLAIPTCPVHSTDYLKLARHS